MASWNAAPVFAALGDATRLDLIRQLCEEGPLPIVKLADTVPVSRQAVTKHLRALEAAGLIRRIGSGRGSVWEIRPKRLNETRAYLEQISAQWDQALSRLKDLVE